MIHKNSKIAYNNILRTGKLRRQELDICATLRIIGRPLTMHEIADYMGVPLNTISGRFCLMVDAKILIIVDTEKRKGKPSRSKYWLCNPVIKQHVRTEGI